MFAKGKHAAGPGAPDQYDYGAPPRSGSAVPQARQNPFAYPDGARDGSNQDRYSQPQQASFAENSFYKNMFSIIDSQRPNTPQNPPKDSHAYTAPGELARNPQQFAAREPSSRNNYFDTNTDQGYNVRRTQPAYDSRDGRQGYYARDFRQGYDAQQDRQSYDAQQERQSYDPRQDRQGYDPRQDRQGYDPRQDRQGYDPRQDRQGYDPRQDRQYFEPRRENEGEGVTRVPFNAREVGNFAIPKSRNVIRPNIRAFTVEEEYLRAKEEFEKKSAEYEKWKLSGGTPSFNSTSEMAANALVGTRPVSISAIRDPRKRIIEENNSRPVISRVGQQAPQKPAPPQPALTHTTNAQPPSKPKSNPAPAIIEVPDVDDMQTLKNNMNTIKDLLRGILEPREDAPREDAPREDAPREDAPREDAPREDAPREDAPREDAPREDAPREDVPREDAPREDAPREDAESRRETDYQKIEEVCTIGDGESLRVCGVDIAPAPTTEKRDGDNDQQQQMPSPSRVLMSTASGGKTCEGGDNPFYRDALVHPGEHSRYFDVVDGSVFIKEDGFYIVETTLTMKDDPSPEQVLPSEVVAECEVKKCSVDAEKEDEEEIEPEIRPLLEEDDAPVPVVVEFAKTIEIAGNGSPMSVPTIANDRTSHGLILFAGTDRDIYSTDTHGYALVRRPARLLSGQRVYVLSRSPCTGHFALFVERL